jgi:hypothetical protein
VAQIVFFADSGEEDSGDDAGDGGNYANDGGSSGDSGGGDLASEQGSLGLDSGSASHEVADYPAETGTVNGQEFEPTWDRDSLDFPAGNGAPIESVMRATTGPPPPRLQSPPQSETRFGVGTGNAVGGAFGLGLFASAQLAANLGANGTDAAGSVFVAAVGLGFAFSPVPSPALSVSMRVSNDVPQAAATTNMGCVSSTLLLSPIGSIQLSKANISSSSGSVADITFTLGLTIGLGIFSGYLCSGSVRSPDRPLFP